MRNLLICVIVFFLSFIGCSIFALPTDWMHEINGDKSISEISIPGTHDSGTYKLKFNSFARTQNLSITEQLNAGARMLDIRLRSYDDALVVHHGSFYCHLNFDDVMKDCINFLQKNPTECILMSVKEEYKAHDSKLTFAQDFMKYAKKYKKFWYLNTKIPKMKDVRGKIALLRRFSSDGLDNKIGLDTSFSDNTSFVYNMGENQFFYCEDLYKSSIKNKKKAILDHINKAIANAGITGDKNNLFMTFTSGYHLVPLPYLYSRIINSWLADLLIKTQSNTVLRSKNTGIIVTDFISSELSSKIYSRNLNTFSI